MTSHGGSGGGGRGWGSSFTFDTFWWQNRAFVKPISLDQGVRRGETAGEMKSFPGTIGP